MFFFTKHVYNVCVHIELSSDTGFRVTVLNEFSVGNSVAKLIRTAFIRKLENIMLCRVPGVEFDSLVKFDSKVLFLFY